MSHGPQFCEKDFGATGGECWWVWMSDKRVTVADARQWCDDNGVAIMMLGDRHFSLGTDRSPSERFVRWIGFVYEDDALLFYLAHL